MLYFRRSRFFRTVVLPLTLVVFLPACHKWVPLEPAVSQAITGNQGTVRVTLTDGQQIIMTTATVTEDSLFGRRKGTPGPVLDTDQNVRLSLDDVQSVEHRRTDGWATAGVIFLGVGIAVNLACAATDCLELDFSN
jgi:hypothetical protein